jgi:uncharacterized membrane protein
MHAGRHYTIREVLTRTRRETLAFVAIALVPFVINHFGVMFVLMLPLGVFTEMKKLGPGWMWLAATSIIMWSFHTMDKVADATENPARA